MRLTDRVTHYSRMLEYFVVFSVVVLMITVSFLALQGILAEARDSHRVGDIATLQSALEMYYSDYGAYPQIGWANSSATSWIALVKALHPYITAVPLDPINDSAERVERTGGFNYSYYSSAQRDVSKGKDDYVLVFRLEKPKKVVLYRDASQMLQTTHMNIDLTEFTGKEGIYAVTAP